MAHCLLPVHSSPIHIHCSIIFIGMEQTDETGFVTSNMSSMVFGGAQF